MSLVGLAQQAFAQSSNQPNLSFSGVERAVNDFSQAVRLSTTQTAQLQSTVDQQSRGLRQLTATLANLRDEGNQNADRAEGEGSERFLFVLAK